MRIGHGYDVHRLVEGRLLILGGVEIPFERGLLGHSDADVITHSVIDALLGAAALGDIGGHFPTPTSAGAGRTVFCCCGRRCACSVHRDGRSAISMRRCWRSVRSWRLISFRCAGTLRTPAASIPLRSASKRRLKRASVLPAAARALRVMRSACCLTAPGGSIVKRTNRRSRF